MDGIRLDLFIHQVRTFLLDVIDKRIFTEFYLTSVIISARNHCWAEICVDVGIGVFFIGNLLAWRSSKLGSILLRGLLGLCFRDKAEVPTSSILTSF
ncbi:hypothetical protein AAFF_G00062480 [Aldrovandia affinis]|uniref:Uncharacterized protein n=1 Tax=Aldrovandia affinis TaxID=143900 RepID=A0AAD7R1N5_9TELE|nr:hypothetical protein AAFF_G00062480 [Aldrovandia affinis]